MDKNIAVLNEPIPQEPASTISFSWTRLREIMEGYEDVKRAFPMTCGWRDGKAYGQGTESQYHEDGSFWYRAEGEFRGVSLWNGTRTYVGGIIETCPQGRMLLTKRPPERTSG